MDKKKIDGILADLDIDDIGEFDGDKYVIKLNDSDDYSYYYTLLDHDENLELVDSSSVGTKDLNVLTYEWYDYKVSLNANFDNDYYNVTIEDWD